ncbi:NAD(P)-binding protein [Pterulicium gracile]|uniref:NAD(P)-binding protein n=1 Tax=Pterulicium gracile TaxID=1884261 RepID=A0A5C3Q8A1_9AGAR|nr:NAD(P)-binding protein [Pterula gracilis]
MGVAYSFITESFPPKPQFNVDRDIPNLTGQVMIVTGGYTGIGYHTVKSLLIRGAKVYIAGRNKEKGDKAIAQLQQDTKGKEALFLELDLADLKSVQNAAAEFIRREGQLHVLFNNGGVMVPPVSDVTADGYDLQFGTNVVGHFYFTKLLLPILLSTAKTTPNGKVRVVNTSSMGHLIGDLDFATFKDGPARRKKSTVMLYAQSKFGNVVYSNQLAKRYGDQGIVSTSLHPGNLKTELGRHRSPWEIALAGVILYDAPYGALTQLWAGTTDEGLKYGGKYLIPWAREGRPNPRTNDEKTGDELWTWLEEQVKDIA